MALLFGGSGGSRNQPKNLVEFRAGKMTLKGNMVHPDKRKGLIYIYQSDDNLTHFCWKDRKTGTVEDDLIVFPDDCEYKKVTQCKDDARVFLLKFKASARKLFFWMQEPKSDSDDDFVWKVNDALNNPGGSGGSNGARGSGSGSATPTPSDREMQQLLSSMSQSQLMQLIGGIPDLGGASGLLAQLSQMSPGMGGGSGGGSGSSGGATAVETGGPSDGSTSENKSSSIAKPEPLLKVKGASKPTPGSASSSKGSTGLSGSAAIQLQDLQKILSNMQPAGGQGLVDLAAGVNSEFIRRITTCPKTVQKLAPLLPQFGGPEVADSSTSGKTGGENQKEVEDTLLSPQFHSALSAFCAAFPTGQLGPLIAQFDMGEAAVEAAKIGNLEAFLNAIQKDANGSQTQDVKPPAADEGEDMNID